MTSLDILHYVISAAIIVIALVIIGVGIGVALLLYEIRKTLQTARKAVDDAKKIKDTMQGIFTKYISLGKNFFKN